MNSKCNYSCLRGLDLSKIEESNGSSQQRHSNPVSLHSENEHKQYLSEIQTTINDVIAEAKAHNMLISENLNKIKMSLYSTQLVKNLMMDLLDLAQMESSTFKINKAQFSMFDAIEEAFVVVSHIAVTKNIKLVPPVVDSEKIKYFKSLNGDKSRFI